MPTSKCVLVTGGAGFIGSHINEMLYRRGYQTIVVDDLSNGHPGCVLNGKWLKGSVCDASFLDFLFKNHSIDAVMHFAALKNVGESVKDPLKYYENNVGGTLQLLSAMQRYGINVFIFSSSAAVYGLPGQSILNEDHPCLPINAYGQTKLIIEKVLEDLSRTSSMRFTSLRYFNAAGGDPEGKIANYKRRDQNLIPLILSSLNDPDAFVPIFGTDYSTKDGTCVRDYIHVDDIGLAHMSAMEKLFLGAPSVHYNLGNGQGFSVKEVVRAIENVTRKKVNVKEIERREGDPPFLVASSEKAKKELNWTPRYPEIESMIEHAWKNFIHSP